MSRPKKYHTPQELREANNAKAKRYRERHANLLKARRQAKTNALKARRWEDYSNTSNTTLIESWTLNRMAELQRKRVKEARARRNQAQLLAKAKEEKALADIDRQATEDLNRAHTIFQQFTRLVPNRVDYIHGLYSTFITPEAGGVYPEPSFFSNSMQPLQRLDALLKQAMDNIYWRNGACREWHRVNEMRREIKQTTDWAEDLEFYATLGVIDLIEAYDSRTLRFLQV